MATALESNKTKIARRVIEVFEFFDQHGPSGTVMDIVRRYGRPQSSTSELLATLVELGLLYKDPYSRSYSPTPRLATLGSGAQPEAIRNGRLFAFMDKLALSTRFGVGLFGMVGTHTQIFRWAPGADPLTSDIGCGASEQLSMSTAGLLLLSTLGSDQSSRLLRRLNAEAPPEQKFNATELGERVAAYRRHGRATGPAGFIPGAQVSAMLLPQDENDRPLALGLVYPKDAAVDTDALFATIERGMSQCLKNEDMDLALAPARLVHSVGA